MIIIQMTQLPRDSTVTEECELDHRIIKVGDSRKALPILRHLVRQFLSVQLSRGPQPARSTGHPSLISGP